MDDDDDGEEGITSTTQGLSAATPPQLERTSSTSSTSASSLLLLLRPPPLQNCGTIVCCLLDVSRRLFLGPSGLELVSYPRYRPIKKPAAHRTPIGRLRPPWTLQLVNRAESPMVTVCLNNIYGRYHHLDYPGLPRVTFLSLTFTLRSAITPSRPQHAPSPPPPLPLSRTRRD